MTEKVYNALLAPTIPIYFGASDIGEYVNIDKLVHCRLPVWKVMELRGYINRHKIRSLVRRHELQVREAEPPPSSLPPAGARGGRRYDTGLDRAGQQPLVQR